MPNSQPAILFVDDDQSIRSSYPLHLRSAGYDVDVAESEESARQFIDRREPGHSYDVVITDMRMTNPESGFNVLGKALSVDLRTQVIILTAYADLPQAVEAMRRGAFGYCPKTGEPGESDGLVMQVKKALDYRRSLSNLARSMGPALEDVVENLRLIQNVTVDALAQATTALDTFKLLVQLPASNGESK
jgi:DNA-binding NtrC family response regulator